MPIFNREKNNLFQHYPHTETKAYRIGSLCQYIPFLTYDYPWNFSTKFPFIIDLCESFMLVKASIKKAITMDNDQVQFCMFKEKEK